MYSVGLITKYWNEEILLPNFLTHLSQLNVSHIIFADDGSTDSSSEIVSSYTHPTSEIHHVTLEQPKSNYFEETVSESQKINNLLNQAYNLGCHWVIHLDIDEVPSVPMIQYINHLLPLLVPHYGIYFSICDLYTDINTFILFDKQNKIYRHPMPHLKIFGCESGYKRTVDQMKLDQGVEGGQMYIMTNLPYLHLKYLFKYRRYNRYNPIMGDPQLIDPHNYIIKTLPSQYIPPTLTTWYQKFHEPSIIW